MDREGGKVGASEYGVPECGVSEFRSTEFEEREKGVCGNRVPR
jgi:hypothetical protein